MRNLTALFLISLLAALGCGGSQGSSPDEAETTTAHDQMPADAAHGASSGMPGDDVHSGAMGEAMGDPMHQGAGINAEINLDPAIVEGWSGIRVRVVELETGTDEVVDIAIGDEAPLGDSGLTLRAVTFIPDFVMGENGITSRSALPQNPAARVAISEDGKDDFEGWLFGAMPEIHPFPHDKYGVVLVEGIPAE